MKRINVLAVIVVMALAASNARAANYTWDGDTGTAGIQDGAGVWDTSTANWWDSVGLVNLAWPNLNTDAASFGGGTAGTAGTITVGTVTANKLTFNAPYSGNYTLNGGTITLSGTAPTITVNSGGASRISSLLACEVGFAKAGAGTITIDNASTDAKLISGTSILGGLRLDAGKLTGLGSVIVGNTIDGTLTLNNSSQVLLTAVNADLQICAVTTEGKTGILTVGNSSTLKVSRDLLLSKTGTGNTDGTATVTVSGGEVYVGGKTRLTNAGDGGGGSTLTISGGSFHTDNILILAHRAKGGTGVDVTISGGTVYATNGVARSTAGFINATTATTHDLKISGTGVLVTSGITSVSDITRVDNPGTITCKFVTTLDGGTIRAMGNNSSFLSGIFTTAPNITANGITFDSAGFDIGFSQKLAGVGKLTKTGLGTLTLGGNNTYAGGTDVDMGVLVLDGSVAGSVAVADGAVLSGSGSVKSIGGAGLINPGNSPGILTAESLDPSSGTDFAFEFTQTGSPTYGTATASGNDVLRLTAADPFTASLASGNTVNVYFNAGTLVKNQVFKGGFYADNGGMTALLNDIKNGTFAYFVADGAGSLTFNSVKYMTLAEYNAAYVNPGDTPWSVTVGTVAETGTFAGGNVNGSVTVLTVVPEPATAGMLLIGLAGVALRRRQKVQQA